MAFLHSCFRTRYRASLIAPSAFGCMPIALMAVALFGQDPGVNPAADQHAAQVELPYVWLGFLQDHSRLVKNADHKTKGNPNLLSREQDRAGQYFRLAPAINTKIIPVTVSFSQRYAPLAAEQRGNREAIQAKKAPGNRQQYLAFLARRDKIILDAVDDLTRVLTPQEFQQLRGQVYSLYALK